MVGSLKLLVILVILFFIIGISLLGKSLRYFFNFESVKLRKSESFWILLTAVLLVLFTLVVECARFRHVVSVLSVFGLLVFSGGVALQFFVIKQKSKFDLKRDLKFEVKGIYKKLRFPGYSALLLMLFGLSIVFESVWAVLLLIALLVPALLYRMAQEDAALADVDEDRFGLYVAETKRIFPGVF